MKSVLYIMIFLLVGSFAQADKFDGVQYDFSPFPLKEGRVAEFEGVWGSDDSMITIELTDNEYWDMPMLNYTEVRSLTGEVRNGFAWVAHSKKHYWLYVRVEDGEFKLQKLYFGQLKNVDNFSKNCKEIEQVMAIMILDEKESLDLPEPINFHIAQESGVCSF